MTTEQKVSIKKISAKWVTKSYGSEGITQISFHAQSFENKVGFVAQA